MSRAPQFAGACFSHFAERFDEEAKRDWLGPRQLHLGNSSPHVGASLTLHLLHLFGIQHSPFADLSLNFGNTEMPYAMGQCVHSKQVAEELLQEDLEDMRNA